MFASIAASMDGVMAGASMADTARPSTLLEMASSISCFCSGICAFCGPDQVASQLNCLAARSIPIAIGGPVSGEWDRHFPHHRPLTTHHSLDSDALRQVPGLVDVAAVQLRDVVGEQLERDDGEHRHQFVQAGGDADLEVGDLGGFV